MPVDIYLVLSPQQSSDPKYYIPAAAKAAGIKDSDIALARIIKRSVDARSRNIKVNLTVQLFIDNEPNPTPIHFDYPDVSNATEVIVVGGGPAGLFAALRLIENGFKPIVLERGKAVPERKKDIATINRNGNINPNSNYAFGEGGAGTFSDGKLYTRSKKRGDYNKALQTLVFHGADPEILYEAHPHIGTDKLPRIISNIRQTIVNSGGVFLFNAKMTGLIIKDSKAVGIEYINTEAENSITDKIEGSAVIIATGHSAHDIYESLYSSGVRLEAKPFAMGVRIEHPQQLIDSIQYHMPDRGEYLPAASYSLVSQINGRGVYSFCMCPGGFIVPAMTDASQSVVNGMSPSQRNSPYANSGIVTEVRLSDFEHLKAEYGELAGLRFQQEFESAARLNGGDKQIAPAQRVADFISSRKSATLPQTSYIPGITSSDMGKWMPRFISGALRGGLDSFGKKMRGFVTNDAIIVGVESRTSTPVRIPRDRETLQHPEITNLYPSGEGAGYAGGIISAALDGERVADAIAAKS